MGFLCSSWSVILWSVTQASVYHSGEQNAILLYSSSSAKAKKLWFWHHSVKEFKAKQTEVIFLRRERSLIFYIFCFQHIPIKKKTNKQWNGPAVCVAKSYLRVLLRFMFFLFSIHFILLGLLSGCIQARELKILTWPLLCGLHIPVLDID